MVGAKARLIYMAGELTTKSSLLQGKLVEWRPDYVQLQPNALIGVDGQPGADAGKVGHAARLSAEPRGESTRYWNRMLTAEILGEKDARKHWLPEAHRKKCRKDKADEK